MIERIYIDNFRTLVNFEWKPGRLALLLGENGSGKTSVFDVLWGLRTLITARANVVRRSFPNSSRTIWDKRPEQRFELDVAVDGCLFRYYLLVEHDERDPRNSRIIKETLHAGDSLLMEFGNGQLHLCHDDGSEGPGILASQSRSALGTITPNEEKDEKLAAFKRWIEEDLWYLRPDPRRMSPRTDQDAETLAVDMANFASWYPTWVVQDLQGAMQVGESLKEILPGFDQLQVNKATLKLQVRFAGESGGRPVGIDFDDLSDGQRQLCALYAMRHAVVKPGYTVLVDEPDNYVALREIQPWLNEVVEASSTEGGPQVFFISHHPELLDQLAPDHGTRFYRDTGPTRIEPFRGLEGLTSSEVVARGWDGE
jgi:predicted ATPase